MLEKEDIALYHQRKRRKHKTKLAIESAIIIVIATIFITAYFCLTKNEYNNYEEKAKVNYRVNLKENEFYEKDYLDEKNTVIASLIKNLEISFKYNLNLEHEQEYTYSYKIVATTNVKEGSRANSIYETTEEILNKGIQESSSKNLEISEKITMDYNEYNDKINKFISIYGLDKTTNTLEISMYVNVTNKYNGEQINKESKVMTLNIPLTTKTVDISINSIEIESDGQIISKKSQYGDLTYVLVIGYILLVIGIAVFINLIKYILDNRRAETMYNQELKRILFNYKSYIQRANNEIDLNNYKIIQINSFDEILGMRDTMQAPILMYTEENENRTKFTIINNDIAYIYVLGAEEIRNELKAKSAMQKAKEAQKNNK